MPALGPRPAEVPGRGENKEVLFCLPDKIECFFCNVPLQFNEEHGFYKCPDCGGEWWPGPTDYGIKNLWRDEQRFKKRMSKKTGGSSKIGRKKEEKKKKPPLYYPYET